MYDLGFSGLIKPSQNPEIIYELKPNLNCYFKIASFRTNSRGLRDKEYEINKPKDTFRIAVIGDSFTMSSGVEIEESYHALLEEWLNKDEGGINYQFINFGTGGYSLRQYWGVIRDKAFEYDPNLIIVGFCPSNDHIVPDNEIFEQPYKVKSQTYPFFKSYVIDKVVLKLKKTSNDSRGQSGEIFSEEQRKYMYDFFSRMNEFSNDNNIKIIIVCLSHRHNGKYVKELEKLVIGNGLHFVDVSLPFKGTDVLEYRINPTDGHPNEKANKVFAEQLYNYINKKDLLK
jgi:hypothetical protein